MKVETLSLSLSVSSQWTSLFSDFNLFLLLLLHSLPLGLGLGFQFPSTIFLSLFLLLSLSRMADTTTSTAPSSSSSASTSSSAAVISRDTSGDAASSSNSSQLRENEGQTQTQNEHQHRFRGHEMERQQVGHVPYHRGDLSGFDDSSTVIRDDTWSCVIVLLTFWFFGTPSLSLTFNYTSILRIWDLENMRMLIWISGNTRKDWIRNEEIRLYIS